MPTPDIPGFHFDPVKRRYFKVQPYQQAPPESRYTRQAIKREEAESRKRQRQEKISRQIALWKPVRRWKKIDSLSRFLYGREIGTSIGQATLLASAWIEGISVGVTDIVNNPSSTLDDCPARVACLAWDPRRGALVAAVECPIPPQSVRCACGRMTELAGGEGFLADGVLDPDGPGLSCLSSIICNRTPTKVCVQSDVTVLAEGSDLCILSPHEPTESTGSPSRAHSLTAFSVNTREGRPIPMMSVRTWRHWIEGDEEIHDLAPRPGCGNDRIHIAVGGERGLSLVTELLPNAYQNPNSGSDTLPARIRFNSTNSSPAVVAVDWLNHNVLIGGCRNGNIYLYDVRVSGAVSNSRSAREEPDPRSVLRVRHAASINSLHALDDVRFIAAGLQDKMSMYDLRYTPRPNHDLRTQSAHAPRASVPGLFSPAVVKYHGYSNPHHRHLAVAVSKQLGIVAAATPFGNVKLFDLWRGTGIEVPKSVKNESHEPEAPVTALHFLEDVDALSEGGRGISLFLGRKYTVEEWTWL